MIRSVIAAIVTSAAIFAAAGVSAEPIGYYVATPVAQPAKPRLITRSTVWQMKDGALVAARAPERDTILCQLLARDVGGLTAFSAGGKAYDADQLATRNAKAGIPATAMAKN